MLPAAIMVLTGVLVGLDSPVALALLLMEGTIALGVLAAAALAGMWLVDLIGLGKAAWRDRLMAGAGLGIGALSLAMLALGMLGWLRPGALLLTGLVIVAGLLRIGFDLRTIWAGHSAEGRSEPGPQAPVRPHQPEAGAGVSEQARRQALALEPFHYLWIIAAPFLAITILAAAIPPGMLWAEEAFGYDVLEYHLAVPKEFFEAGRIFFMPYNVYSNFPLNGGMLWLLMMELRGDGIDGAFTVNGVNLGLGILFAAAAWWAARIHSHRAGVVAGVLAASTAWVAYLAGIAYVEPGMLAMGMLALGATLRAAGSDKSSNRWAIAAGLLAGIACGYKYTAVPLIAVPLAVILLAGGRAWADRGKQVGLFAVAAVLAFSPWMARNLMNTGNPVFPLAYSVFGAKPGVWDDELQARWERGHGWEGVAWEDGDSPLRLALDRTIFDQRLGPGLVILALAGALLRWDRWTAAMLVVLALQVLIWFGATHLFARFAVVMLLPLIILAARLATGPGSPVRNAMLAATLVLAGALNLYQLGGLYYIHTRAGTEGQPINAHGHLNWFVDGEWPGYDYLKYVNNLEGSPRVMFVGEARTFYVRPPRDYAVVFSRHPLAAAVRELVGPARPNGPGEPGPSSPAPTGEPDALPGVALASTGADQHAPRLISVEAAGAEQYSDREAGYRAVLKWLADRGITHVLVQWFEMDRLRRTYGLDAELTPELFTELESAGLLRMGDFMVDDHGMPYATLYEVP